MVVTSEKSNVAEHESKYHTLNATYSSDVVESLMKSKKGETVDLPGFESATVLDTYLNESLSKATRAQSWKVCTADSQTIYFKRVWYEKEVEKPQLINKNTKSKEVSHLGREKTVLYREADFLEVKSMETSVKLIVDNLDESKFFFEKVLGLTCSKHSRGLYRYGNIWLSEKPLQRREGNQNNKPSYETSMKDDVPDVWIKVDSLDVAYQNVERSRLPIIRKISYNREQARYFVCQEPSGYLVLVNEATHAD